MDCNINLAASTCAELDYGLDRTKCVASCFIHSQFWPKDSQWLICFSSIHLFVSSPLFRAGISSTNMILKHSFSQIHENKWGLAAGNIWPQKIYHNKLCPTHTSMEEWTSNSMIMMLLLLLTLFWVRDLLSHTALTGI